MLLALARCNGCYDSAIRKARSATNAIIIDWRTARIVIDAVPDGCFTRPATVNASGNVVIIVMSSHALFCAIIAQSTMKLLSTCGA